VSLKLEQWRGKPGKKNKKEKKKKKKETSLQTKLGSLSLLLITWQLRYAMLQSCWRLA